MATLSKPKKKSPKSKTATKRKPAKRGGAATHTVEYYKDKARKMGIPLSKNGKTKTKKQLQSAISARKSASSARKSASKRK